MLRLAPATVFGPPVAQQLPLRTVRIEDAPRFAWRGAMLGSVRYFLQVYEVMNFVDQVSRHKLDALQWHLTDDQGWRIASDRYPLLAKKASWRAKTSNRDWGRRHLAQVVVTASDRSPPSPTMLGYEASRLFLRSISPPCDCRPVCLPRVRHGSECSDRDRTLSADLREFSPAARGFVHTIWSELLDATGARYAHIGGDEVLTVQ